MPSIYVPARAVAQRRPSARRRVSRSMRDLAMLLALAAPAALAQQAAQPASFDASMSNTSAGVGDARADKYEVAGMVGMVGGTASGGTYSLISGGTPTTSPSSAQSDMIFLSSFD